ncbi:MAG: hypothetical protein IT493_12015 [Gammaproteobacteria bacterium]|nr:hypothetical protein [Gammaproteobacteria bacterium]
MPTKGSPFVKGEKRPATSGRRKGTPNKATRDVRAAIAAFSQDNVENMQKWLVRIARRDPGRAFELYIRVLEFHVPKLARTEVTGGDGTPLTVQVVRFTDAPTMSHPPPDAEHPPAA